MAHPRSRRLVPLLSLIGLLLVPLFLGTYPMFVLTSILILSIFAMSLDVLIGHLGYTSFGHAAFFGVGAYAAVIGARLGQPFWSDALIALAAVVVVALMFGPIALRTTGLAFIMISLALAQALWGLAYRWSSVTGGDNGLSAALRPAFPGLGRLESTHAFPGLGAGIVGRQPIASVPNGEMPTEIAPEIELLLCIARLFRELGLQLLNDFIDFCVQLSARNCPIDQTPLLGFGSRNLFIEEKDLASAPIADGERQELRCARQRHTAMASTHMADVDVVGCHG